MHSIKFTRCIYDSCSAKPIARCLRCSKYYCYVHLQLCFQTHPNEIEIINPLKNKMNVGAIMIIGQKSS